MCITGTKNKYLIIRNIRRRPIKRGVNNFTGASKETAIKEISMFTGPILLIFDISSSII